MGCEDRILIVSNNVISKTKNNGKTIASIFEEYPKENIRQLYFSSELPEDIRLDSYYQISDKDVLKSLLKTGSSIGKIQRTNVKKLVNTNQEKGKKIPKNNLTRLIREVIWKLNFKKFDSLFEWLDDFQPQKIFFVGGDSLFAYDITKMIKDKYKSKLLTYITDDYILPRKTVNMFWWIRRNLLLRKMKPLIKETSELITISEKMRNEYKNIFNKDSLLLMNKSESLKDNSIQNINNTRLYLIYAGGLHYNRYQVLSKIGEAIASINKKENTKIKLFIYTNEQPTDKIMAKLNIENGSEYSGTLNRNELKIKLNECAIPVHVESFNKKSIEATRLSVSTKISEYMSLEKPILAVGPKEVASMEYLEGIAYCINEENLIEKDLKKLLSDFDLQKKLSLKARNQFDNNDLLLRKNIEYLLNN
ncbi:glycosyltransferase family protein [Fundicoccus culcitae]|uniref:Glycosyl transferase family 1 domain-containing protein n=1 Tax=Fundicoccus culcitae TaxID=2969821 RepID=A0ABY5P911_9LACT|nr:hypothetical protein [Fundicoccus culcitae]UUX35242.1 hypothetical protein NRE15_06255 [Fundicoccus culcitae]